MNTNHTFKPSILTPIKCAICYRAESEHGVSVTCESCTNTDKLELVNGIWMCPDCKSKELELAASPKEPVVINEPIKPEVTGEFVARAVSYMAKDINKPIVMPGENVPREITEIEHTTQNTLGSESIQHSSDFFNARVKPIDTRWNEILADASIPEMDEKHYSLARELREHYIHLKSVLFSITEEQLKTIAEMRADQTYLNQLAPKLREEQRVKLHLQNIDYVPVAPKATPKKVKVNKDDQMAADYARIMNIPIETAKRLIENKMKEVLGAECTCAETPGICKIHVK